MLHRDSHYLSYDPPPLVSTSICQMRTGILYIHARFSLGKVCVWGGGGYFWQNFNLFNVKLRHPEGATEMFAIAGPPPLFFSFFFFSPLSPEFVVPP